MSETLLSSRNLAFELYEVLDAEGLTQRERFAEHTRETFDAAIGTGHFHRDCRAHRPDILEVRLYIRTQNALGNEMSNGCRFCVEKNFKFFTWYLLR